MCGPMLPHGPQYSQGCYQAELDVQKFHDMLSVHGTLSPDLHFAKLLVHAPEFIQDIKSIKRICIEQPKGPLAVVLPNASPYESQPAQYQTNKEGLYESRPLKP